MRRAIGGCRFRAYLTESDRWKHKPLYEAIVEEALKLGLAGATVIRGSAGYGAHGKIHTTRILRLAEDLPIIVEIIDERERIDALITQIDSMMVQGAVTLEAVELILYAERDSDIEDVES